MDAAIIGRIALETAIPESSVAATVALFENGATGPFLVHYRKEATGGLDEIKVRSIQERMIHYREVWDQRAALLKFLSEQGKLTDELREKIESCFLKAELDDLHHQFRPRRKTRSIEALEKGLGPLAEYFWNQESDAWNVEEHINVFVDPAKGVSTQEQALQGIVDIIAEWIWENFEYRKALRDLLWTEGFVVSSVVPAKVGQKTKYNMYYERRESVTTIPSHRVLAIRRGCKEGILVSSIEADNSKALNFLIDSIIKDKESIFAPVLEAAARESYARILRPLIETEVRTQLKERADREAIKVFQENLTNLLLSPPAGPLVVMGIDWGKGDECSIAVVNEKGAFLEGGKIRFGSKPETSSSKASQKSESKPPDSESPQTERQTAAEPAATEQTQPAASTPTAESVDPPASESAADPVTEPVDPPAPEPAAEPAAESAAQPIPEPPTEHATATETQPAASAQTTESDDQPTSESAEAPAKNPATGPAEESSNLPETPEETASSIDNVKAHEPTLEADKTASEQPPETAQAETAAVESSPVGETAAIVDNPVTPLLAEPASKAEPESRNTGIQEARITLQDLITKHKVQAISISSGTGARELETALRQIVSEEKLGDILIAAVNDAGIAIYSSSRIAREEFPDWNASARCAVSLARRLQDPLSELVKIDPKLIGVGQYQHDVDQKELHRGLLQTVQYCVNKVGVNANTAGESLLRYVSGLNDKIARRIVACRKAQGTFRSRAAIKSAVGLDDTTYQQAAAFMRIPDSENPLDRTAVHPESYPIVEKMAAALEIEVPALIGNKERISSLNLEDYVTEPVGMPTLKDIREELLRPGRDPRKSFKIPKFRADVREMSDLKPGMALEGTVTNVTNFGAFVDIGVRQDGLVHLSQMSNRFIRDPREAVKVGDVVQVKVISVEPETKRIGLSMKALLPTGQRRRKKSQRRGPRNTMQGRQSGKNSTASGTGADANTASTEAGSHQKPYRSREGAPRHRKRGPRKQDREESQRRKESSPKGPEPTLQEKIAILQSKFRGIS